MELTKENIGRVERYFKKYPAPKIPMKINVCTIVNDPPKMITTHLATCKTYLGDSRSRYRALPYWDRLILVGKLTKKYYDKLNNK